MSERFVKTSVPVTLVFDGSEFVSMYVDLTQTGEDVPNEFVWDIDNGSEWMDTPDRAVLCTVCLRVWDHRVVSPGDVLVTGADGITIAAVCDGCDAR